MTTKRKKKNDLLKKLRNTFEITDRIGLNDEEFKMFEEMIPSYMKPYQNKLVPFWYVDVEEINTNKVVYNIETNPRGEG